MSKCARDRLGLDKPTIHVFGRGSRIERQTPDSAPTR